MSSCVICCEKKRASLISIICKGVVNCHDHEACACFLDLYSPYMHHDKCIRFSFKDLTHDNSIRS